MGSVACTVNANVTKLFLKGINISTFSLSKTNLQDLISPFQCSPIYIQSPFLELPEQANQGFSSCFALCRIIFISSGKILLCDPTFF
jgi:hypothetical protein